MLVNLLSNNMYVYFFLNKIFNNYGKDGYNRYDKICKYISVIYRFLWDIFE